MLNPLVVYEHSSLCLSGSGRHSQETVISGSCQQALLGICNSVWVWWLYMGWIPSWGSLWMACPSMSAPHFVSHEYFVPPSRKDWSIHTLVLCLLDHHLVCELFLWYCELLDSYPLISEWIPCVYSCDWVTSVSMLFSSSIHFPMNFMKLFFYTCVGNALCKCK